MEQFFKKKPELNFEKLVYTCCEHFISLVNSFE